MSDALTDVVERMTRAYTERLEREILGAWRAGYDYLHVYRGEPLPDSGRPMGHKISRYVLPTDEKHPPKPDRYVYEHTYCIGDTRDELMRQLTDSSAGMPVYDNDVESGGGGE